MALELLVQMFYNDWMMVFLLQSKQKKSFHSFGKNIHEQRHEIHILEYSSNRIIVESNLTNYIWLVNYVKEEGSHWTYTHSIDLTYARLDQHQSSQQIGIEIIA